MTDSAVNSPGKARNAPATPPEKAGDSGPPENAPANAPENPPENPRPEPTRYGDWEKSGRCIDF